MIKSEPELINQKRHMKDVSIFDTSLEILNYF
jgi:hypothetical protein